MAACRRCGSETPTDAKFCPECGAELRAEVADLEPLVEAGPAAGGHVEATEAPPSRWLLVGAVALIGALVAFFALVDEEEGPSADPFEDRADFAAIDEPDGGDDVGVSEEPATETEAAPPPAEIESALNWDVVLLDGVGFPGEPIDIGDSTFVFSREGDLGRSAGGRLRTYHRGPDGEWRDLGDTLGAEALVTGVWPSTEGAIAVGSTEADGPTVWRTTDGLGWTADVLPPSDEPAFADAVPLVAADTGALTIVIGNTPDPWSQLYAALLERFPGIDAGLDPDIGAAGTSTVTIRGPFGIIIEQVDVGELGIDVATLDAFYGDDGGLSAVPVWQNRGDGWTSSTLDTGLYGVFTRGDELVGVGHGETGPELRTLGPDGWGEPVTFDNVWQVEPWGDRYVGTGGRRGVTVFDALGTEIDDLRVPGSDPMASLTGLTAGDGGLVVVDSTWEPTEQPSERVRTVVLRDGFSLEASDGELQLRRGEESVLRSSLFWQGGTDHYEVELDAAEPAVTFLSDAGEPLVAFTIAELHQLEQESWSIYRATERHRVVFTRDGERWHGGDVEFDRGLGFLQPHLTEDRIVATQLQGETAAWNRNPTDFRFMIVEAPLPD